MSESNESQYPRWYAAKTKLIELLVERCGANPALTDEIIDEFFRFHCFEVYVNVYTDNETAAQTVSMDSYRRDKAIMRLVEEIMAKGLVFSSSREGRFERVDSYRLVLFASPRIVGPSPSKSE